MDFGLIIALPDANQTRMGILTLQVWEIFAMRVFNRVGVGITPAVLPHHRTYGSVYGGSCRTFEPMILSHQRYQSESIKELLR